MWQFHGAEGPTNIFQTVNSNSGIKTRNKNQHLTYGRTLSKFKLSSSWSPYLKLTLKLTIRIIASLNEGGMFADIKILMQTAGITRGSNQPEFYKQYFILCCQIKDHVAHYDQLERCAVGQETAISVFMPTGLRDYQQKARPVGLYLCLPDCLNEKDKNLIVLICYNH